MTSRAGLTKVVVFHEGGLLKRVLTVLICEYCGIHNEMYVAIQCTCSTTLAGAAMGT